MLRWKDKKIDALDGGKLAKHWVTYGILLLAMGAMTFFGVCDPMHGGMNSGGMNLSGNAAKVKDQEISALEFRRAYQEVYTRYQRQFSEGFDPAQFGLSSMVLNQLVNDRVAYNLAVDSGISTSDDEVEKVIADAEVFHDDKGKFSGERFEQFLKSQRFTEEGFTEDVRRQLTSEKFRRFLTDTTRASDKSAEWRYKLTESKMDVDYVKIEPKTVKVAVSDADAQKFLDAKGKEKVKQYYDTHKSEFNTDKKVKASHVLISFTGARNASGPAAVRSKEDARKLAEQVAAEVNKGGDFVAVAKKYTDDPSGKSNGGDLGFFSPDAMVKEFSDAAFKMNKGQVSAPVESPFGFHIIKVVDIQEARNTSLEAATPEIARKILGNEKKPELVAALAKDVQKQLQEGKNIDGVLQQNGLKWDSTGSFALSSSNIPKLGGQPALKDAIYSLSKSQPIASAPVESGEAYYILRLKNRQDADMKEFNKEKKEEMERSASFMDAYGIYNTLTAAAEKSYKDKGEIWVNDEFRDLDLRRQQGGS